MRLIIFAIETDYDYDNSSFNYVLLFDRIVL